jgi:hypothetical protein
MSSWDDVRAKLRRGEAVTVDELAAAIAAGPVPRDVEITATLRPQRGRPPDPWNPADLDVIANMCTRVRLWSEWATTALDGTCRPLPMREVYSRVARALRRPVSGKALENLLRTHSRTRGRPAMRLYRDEDFHRVFRVPPP